MAVFKCKMCGGELEIQEGLTVCECEYCETTQTIPSLDNEKKMTLFNRANKLRFNNEFDKASAVYENIVAEFPEEAEGYWGLVLCKYGIEYVDDKKTAKKIPTCHRTVPSAVTKDENFKKAIECADVVAQKLYKEEAKAIDKLQKQILKIVENEEPYDVFICYKETDSKGKRTDDSTIAQDIYTELVKADYKVFFARVTLRDKAGSDYEPYIYSALSSAKVMLAIGTKEEYYDAVWVKNEWGRYLSMMADDKSKHLIPCYKDIDAYDIPDDFKNLQALNMGDVTFYKDLMSAIEKFVPKKKEVVKETVVVSADNAQVAPLLERVFMFLEDGDFKSANEYCEKVLDLDPKNAEAYLGKLMADLQVEKKKELKKLSESFEKNANYKKIVRFGSEELKNELQGYIDFIIAGAETRALTAEYNEAVKAMKSAKTEAEFKKVAKLFEKLKGFKDSEKRVEECLQKAAEVPLKKKYDEAVKAMKSAKTEAEFNRIAKLFEKLKGFKDSEELCAECKEKAEELKEISKKKQPILAEKRKKLSKLEQLVSAGSFHTVGVKSDGTVVATKYTGKNYAGQCAVQCWTDVVGVSAALTSTVGLKSDGTVVAAGLNIGGKFDVDGWKDIVAISAGNDHTVGLKSDGTVVAVGENNRGQCNVDDWTGIVAISAGDDHTVGLKLDGTVIATKYTGNKKWYAGQCEVQDWSDIVAVAAGNHHTVGLKSDGTVVAVGRNDYGECDVQDWTDIVAISTGKEHTVGLKLDGTIVVVGSNSSGQCKVRSMTDIVAISAGSFHTVGLKSDGTVVAVGKNDEGQCNVESWKLFDDFENLEEEQKRIQEEKKRIEEEKERIKAQKVQYRSQGFCQHCGGQLKGLFSKKCANCGKPKDY